MYNMFILLKAEIFFRQSFSSYIGAILRELFIKLQNQNIFQISKKTSLISDIFSFRRCIIYVYTSTVFKGMGEGAGRGCPTPPPSCILQNCVFVHRSVFRLLSLLPIYSLSFTKPKSETQKLNESPSRKTGFLP